MKIIILNDYAYVNGGAGKIAISSALSLAEKSYDVILFTAVGPVAENLKNVKNLQVVCLEQFDILHDNKRWRAIINGLWNRKAENAFENILKNFNKKDTVIHVHSFAKSLSVSYLYAAIKKEFKIVFHLHDYGVVCPNMGFFNYQKEKVCYYDPLSYKCIFSNCDSRSYFHKIWRCLRQVIQIKIAGFPIVTKYFIAVSNFSYCILKKHLPAESKIFIVQNPININRAERVEVEKNKHIIFVGRLSREKNPILLAKVSAKMQLPVIFIGNGPCEKELKQIYPDAIITGWIEGNRINEYLRKARCLVFPSILFECQGLSVLEALGNGIPVIASDICAAKDSFIDKESGIIFENNNEISLEKALIELKNDILIRKMGCKAYENYWLEDHDMETYTNKMIEIYKTILNS